MQATASTICLPHLSWDDALRVCAECGFTRVELMAIAGYVHIKPGEIDPDLLQRHAAAVGVQIVSLHAGGLDGASDQALADSLQHVQACVRLAQTLRAHRVVFNGGYWPHQRSPQTMAPILARFAQGLRQLIPLLEQGQVCLAVENHYHYQLQTLDDFHEVFVKQGITHPQIGTTLDTGHFHASGIAPAHAAHVLGPSLRNLHVKDHVGHQSVPLGEGEVDFDSVVTTARGQGYDGDLTVEIELENQADRVDALRRAHPFLQRLIQLAAH